MNETFPGKAHVPTLAELAGEPLAIDREYWAAVTQDKASASDLVFAGKWYPEKAHGAAILPMQGLLYGYSYDVLAMGFLAALDDDNVEEIWFRCGSPGGVSAGAFELSDLVYNNRGRKPIKAIAVNGLMGSACYLIASAADEVYATVGSKVGSIGIIATHVDYSAAHEQEGRKYTIICEPEDKKLFNPHEALSAEDIAKWRETSTLPQYQMFVDRVARNRGVDEKAVRDGYGQGLALLAADALKAGLIDKVVDYNEMLIGLAAENQPQSSNLVSRMESPMQITERMKAALLTEGLIDSMQASDGACEMAFSVFAKARGAEAPKDEAAAIELLKAPAATPGNATPAQATTPGNATTDSAGNVLDVDSMVKQAAAQGVLDEQARQNEIRERASLLGIEDGNEELAAALTDPTTTAAAFSEAVMAKAVTEKQPLHAVPNGTSVASYDKLTEMGVAALVQRATPGLISMAKRQGHDIEPIRQRIKEAASHFEDPREVMNMSGLELAKQSLMALDRMPADRTPQGYAKAFLELSGSEHAFSTYHPMDEMASMVSPVRGPADYPLMMDGFLQIVTEFALDMSPFAYWRWAKQDPNLPNKHPREKRIFGGVNELDLLHDGHKVSEGMIDAARAWIKGDRFAKGFSITEDTVLQNEFNAVAERTFGFQLGHERTLGRLLFNLLISNANSPIDGNPMYSTGDRPANPKHPRIVGTANDIAVGQGGGPSEAQAEKMDLMLTQMPPLFDDEESGNTMNLVVVGSKWKHAARRHFVQPAGTTTEVPTSSADVNLFRGNVDVVYDPLFSQTPDPSGSAAHKGYSWFGFYDPQMLPAVIYCFLEGFGPGGRRITYYDPSTRSTKVEIHGGFGGALEKFQGVVRNPGR